MLFFENDYSEGAHEQVLQHLVNTTREKLLAYGADRYSEAAREKIRLACQAPNAEIFFLAGGTQSNQVVIDALLAPQDGAIAAKTGHIALHEAGAIEATGHKVLELPQENGKLQAEVVRTYLQDFYNDTSHEHMVAPGLVYISHPTEYGTLYTESELAALRKVCDDYELKLYLDGARLGYALACPESDITLPILAKYCDAFYIGGTKVGALCGEAVVFPQNAPKHFNTQVKRHGAMLAKSRVVGVQFDALFTDDLYYKLGRYAIQKARQLRAALQERNYRFFIDSPSNQIFVIMDNERLKELSKHVQYSFWEKYDEKHTVIRFATSWATEQEDLDSLIALL
ncbi:MAG: aminotransferase class V-fold PLP-dependent enzyme [Ruminococcaceae bacterium]|nr:aminotransferase class V-fold PLP-dependent enzyme [Oscillospiraceae bacterium]